MRLEGFECRCCGNCCRVPGVVRVSEAEADAIADFLHMNVYAFAQAYTQIAPDRKTLVLAGQVDDACIFLMPDSRCRIHPVKPIQCRTYPERWRSDDIESVCPART